MFYNAALWAGHQQILPRRETSWRFRGAGPLSVVASRSGGYCGPGTARPRPSSSRVMPAPGPPRAPPASPPAKRI